MKIGIFHGYELTGSGSNEYTRYLARSLLNVKGTQDNVEEIHIICREAKPELIDFVSRAYRWNDKGRAELLYKRENMPCHRACILHQLPMPAVNAVYLTDKQRSGNVKSFVNLSDRELDDYEQSTVCPLHAVLKKYPVDILHTNHLIYQPVAAMKVCKQLKIPYIIYPHGSSLEYVIRQDERYKKLALKAILASDGLIIGNNEVRERIVGLYPEYRDLIMKKSKLVGVGVETDLFLPIAREKRAASVEKIIEAGPFKGKSREDTLMLFKDLDKSGVFVTTKYQNAYKNNVPDSNLEKKLHEIPWERSILIFVGALTVGKGIQSVITALPFILKKTPGMHFLVVGSGAYREALEGFVYAITTGNKKLINDFIEHGYDLDCNELKGPWLDVKKFLSGKKKLYFLLEYGRSLDKHIHFLGRMDHEILKFIFPCADISVFPSVFPEAYPLVLMESLSNGVFPVVSYFSGFKDEVDNLKKFLPEEMVELMKISIDPKNRIKSIIRSLSVLSGKQEELQNVSLKLHEISVNNFDWKIRALQMLDAYVNIIKQKHNLNAEK